MTIAALTIYALIVLVHTAGLVATWHPRGMFADPPADMEDLVTLVLVRICFSTVLILSAVIMVAIWHADVFGRPS